MLNPNDDRKEYGQLLTAPDDYKLDFAIGTTYSLDLDALIGACLALGVSIDADSNIPQNPIALLYALRETGAKIALFCQAGQIKLPSKEKPLYILLEEMVYQVALKKKGFYPSFHPKFWLIRYVNEDDKPLYRVMILSRNLTFDRSWDVTFCMNGKLSDIKTEKNQPINDFIEYLLDYLPDEESADERTKDKLTRISKILSELPNVDFKTDLDKTQFYDYELIPVGVKKKDGDTYSINNHHILKDKFDEILIMSPFLSEDIITGFYKRKKTEESNYTLFTRAMSLPRIRDCCAKWKNFKIYTLKDNVIDGESAIDDESIVSEEDNNIQKQDIHAKIYMVRENSDSDLYLGSLNASHNAAYGNIEFMIRLRSKNRDLIKNLTNDLFCGDENNPNNPFQLVEDITGVEADGGETDNKLDSVIKSITRFDPSAEFSQSGDNYRVDISFKNEYEIENGKRVLLKDEIKGYTVSLSPLSSDKTALLENTTVCFDNLSLVQLSKFYKITVSDGENKVSRVIIIPSTDGFPEGRDEAVVSSVVHDEKCFYQYLSLLMSEDFAIGASRLLAVQSEGEAARHNTSAIVPGLYEMLLQTAANDPEKFNKIESLIKTADKVVPEDFKKIYNIFKKAVEHHV